jgi:hypothetical protein
MSNEKQAELARKQHSESLRRKGAHAISVEQVPVGGRKQFAIVASFGRKPKKKLPSSLKVRTRSGEVKIPLVARQEEQFHLQ